MMLGPGIIPTQELLLFMLWIESSVVGVPMSSWEFIFPKMGQTSKLRTNTTWHLGQDNLTFIITFNHFSSVLTLIHFISIHCHISKILFISKDFPIYPWILLWFFVLFSITYFASQLLFSIELLFLFFSVPLLFLEIKDPYLFV